MEKGIERQKLSRRRLPIFGLFLISICSPCGAEPKEYCFPKSFNVTCPEAGQVILMTSAKYGRMVRGECVTSDYFVGCWQEVLTYMDHKCSGKSSCFLAIPDAEMHQMQSCPKDLLAYLEADYECVKTQNLPTPDECQREGMALVRLSGSSHGWLSSFVSLNSGLGSEHCPWVIVVNRGQTVKLTLYDFGVALSTLHDNNNNNHHHNHLCTVYAKVRDVGHHSDFTVCGGRSRERVVHQSEGNRVEVTLMNVEREGQVVNFLLKYEATGCSDPVLPGSSILLRREGDTAVVSCNLTSQVWHIVCQGNTWFGKMDNCTNELMQSSHPTMDRNVEYFKNGLFVAVVIGLILGLLIGFLMLTIIVVCNRNRRNTRRDDDIGERNLQYEVKLQMNKNSSRTTESEFECCDGSGKWTPGCQGHQKPLPDSAVQSKLIIYGVPAQGYQQLQQQQQTPQNLQYQYHHHHHHLLHHHHHQQLQDEHRLPSTSPQLTLSSSVGYKKSSSDALNDLPTDSCFQQFPKKFEIYDKPLPCYNSFSS